MSQKTVMLKWKSEITAEVLASIDRLLEEKALAMLRETFGSGPATKVKAKRAYVRGAVRAAAPEGVKKTRKRQSCPVAGCKNVFAPRFGGFCKAHHGSAGFKKWFEEKHGTPVKARKPAVKKARKVKASKSVPIFDGRSAKPAKVAKPKKAKPAKVKAPKKAKAAAANGAQKETQVDRNARLEAAEAT